ncbi:MAG TPA: 2-amino-4-hydroxy-6-hydroxymethyldihydropteridine diphosphokinase [Steroidobacteraceae bacterium]|nr:2-amino-4-hydroxy-6-hydroxymethyldihydropteridine diphosphokinase [Steroidobacteraceae bacterium]
MHWVPAYVGLGSNLDGPQAQVLSAFTHLAAIARTRCVVQSRLYVSTPLGPADQPDFVNAAAGLLTQLSAVELLHELKRIESDMGRTPPPVRWGPRRIDLDLLLYDGLRLQEPGLTLPHPGIHARNFVLYPLADIAPALFVPGHGPVDELARQLGSKGLRPLARARQRCSPRGD